MSLHHFFQRKALSLVSSDDLSYGFRSTAAPCKSALKPQIPDTWGPSTSYDVQGAYQFTKALCAFLSLLREQ